MNTESNLKLDGPPHNLEKIEPPRSIEKLMSKHREKYANSRRDSGENLLNVDEN